VDREKFERITRSALEGLARKELNLARLISKRAEAKERRLVPEVIEEFFLEGGPVAGISPRREKPFVARVGRLPRQLLEIGRSFESRYGRLGREYRRVAFDRVVLEEEPTLEWVTPGHPLFEAVREAVWRRAQDDLRRGAVFFDLHRDTPARLDVYDCSIKDGTGQTLHRRLFVVEASADGFALRQPTVFLDLSTGHGEPPPITVGSREESERFLVEEALEDFLEEVREEREQEVETISRHVEVSLNTLIDRLQVQVDELMQRQARGDEGAAGNLAQALDRLDQLNERLERRREELAKQWQLTLADLSHVGSAWVLPHPERTGELAQMVRDPVIEAIAMREAMAYEEAHGWQPEDVSKENRGFDVLSRQCGGPGVRFLEVKGRAAVGPIALTANEYRTARRLGEDFWLYAIFDCGSSPRLVRVQDPARLGWEPVVKIEHYTASAHLIEEAASTQ